MSYYTTFICDTCGHSWSTKQDTGHYVLQQWACAAMWTGLDPSQTPSQDASKWLVCPDCRSEISKFMKSLKKGDK